MYAVNPKHRRLDGQSVYARIDELPAPADLAVVCTPAATVPGIVAELGRCGTRAAVVLSAGLDAAQRQAMLDAARPHLLRVLGPGCVGMLSPHIGLNASIAHSDAAAGELAFVSQSGSLVSAMLDWARARAHRLLAGGVAGPACRRRCRRHARPAGQRSAHALDPAVRGGGRVAAQVHVGGARRGAQQAGDRGALRPRPRRAQPADADRVYDAAFARAGMLRVGTLQQMFLAAETLTRFRGNRSEQLAILSNGSGAGALAADAAAQAGVRLCALQPDDAAAPAAAAGATAPLPAAPLQLPGDAAPEAYVQALQALAEDAAAPALLLIHAPSAVVSSAQVARALLPLAQQTPPQLMGCWLGHAAVAEARRVFQQAGVASYATPEEAVSAFSMLVDYRRNQAQLIEAPPSRSRDIGADAAAARALVQRALGSGRTLLEGEEARALLAAYGIDGDADAAGAGRALCRGQRRREDRLPGGAEDRLARHRARAPTSAACAWTCAAPCRCATRPGACSPACSAALPEARIDGFASRRWRRPAHARALIVGGPHRRAVRPGDPVSARATPRPCRRWRCRR